MKMPIMDRLHADHVNYAKLLDLMESLLSEQKKGSDKGYLELYLIMNYMTRYPDIFHHPYEDIIFDELENIENAEKQDIEDLKAEHKKIYEASMSLLGELDAVVNGHIVDREKIQTLGSDYSLLMREHMNKEEGRVFPMINEKMTSRSWDKIKDSLKQVNDPVFDGPLSDEFKILHDQIMNGD